MPLRAHLRRRPGSCGAALAGLLTLAADAAEGQDRPPGAGGTGFDASAAVAAHPRAALDGGGGFSMTRSYFSAGADRPVGGRNSIGLSLGGGVTEYDFSAGARIEGADPWNRIESYTLSAPAFLRLGEDATGLVIPSLRHAGEPGVSFADGQSFGAIAGVFWRISDRLSLGPGGGAFREVDGETVFFPILLIDWAVTDRWTLSTGRGLGASRGPGLSLDYAATDTLRLGVAARYENAEFRLDDDGPAADGFGYDRSVPVVATLDWRPRARLSVAGFAGMSLAGRLTLRDADGDLVDRRDYDPVPILGASVSLDF